MSFRANESQQLQMNDSFLHLTERERRMLKNSWAAYFGDHIFPRINEKAFAVLYSESTASRHNTPVNVIIGALHLKSMFGLTDEELLEAVLFDVRFKYALRTTSLRADAQERLNSDALLQLKHIRNVVEALPSLLRRRYGADTLPIRGLFYTSLWFGASVGALNAVRVLHRLMKQGREASSLALFYVFLR